MSTAPRIMAVIHHRDDHTSLANATIAANAGCDGVFLIQMDGRDDLIDGPAVQIKTMFPELIVGTNRLSTPPLEAVERDVTLGLDATWCDNPGIRGDTGASQRAIDIAAKVAQVKEVRPEYLYFGSVAFKYQSHDDDPVTAALVAARAGFVATTSGRRTGEAPDVSKLEAMKTALGSRPLAVASGVSPQNIGLIAPHVDWVLVATGVSRTFHDFDAALLGDLVAKATNKDNA